MSFKSEIQTALIDSYVKLNLPIRTVLKIMLEDLSQNDEDLLL